MFNGSTGKEKPSFAPGRVRLFSIILLTSLVAGYIGHELAGYRVTQLGLENRQLAVSQKNLLREHERLSAELNQVKVELDIAQQALDGAMEEYVKQLDEQRQYREQLAFYRSVMAPEQDAKGFSIDSIEINQLAGPNQYLLRLTLVQKDNFNAVVSGSLKVSIVGTEGGSVRSFDLSELQPANQKTFDYAFRYFQILSVEFELPENFTAQRVEFTTDTYKLKRREASYQRTIQWSDAYTELGISTL